MGSATGSASTGLGVALPTKRCTSDFVSHHFVGVGRFPVWDAANEVALNLKKMTPPPLHRPVNIPNPLFIYILLCT